MKTYDIKYEIGQKVFILLSKKIYKSRIEKIRILHSRPYFNSDMEEMDGIVIDYLVVINEQENFTDYDWVNQNDIYLDKNELLKKIL